MLDRSARFMRDQPALTRLLIRAITDRSHPDLHPLRFAAPLDHFIDGITERAIARGEIGPSDGDELRYLLRAMLWGLSIVGVDDRTRRSASIRGFQRLFAGDLLKDHGAGPGAARRPAVARSS